MKNVPVRVFSFFLIAVFFGIAGVLTADTAPTLELISPGRGQELGFGDEVVIAVSIYDQEGDVDLDSIELEVDGVDVTSRASLSVFLVTYLFEEPTDVGRHDIELTVEDRQGNSSLLTAFFSIAPEPVRERQLTYNGSVSAGLEYDKEADPDVVATGELEAYGSLTESLDYSLNVELTNDEATDGQRISTYRADLYWPWGSLSLGDTTPRFSDYTLDGRELFGVHFSPQFGFFGLELVWGQSFRSVDDPETFEQWVYAARIKLGDTDAFQWSLNFVKAKDDVDSLDSPSSVTPKDNLVLGTDFVFRFFDGVFRLELEGNESLLNDDITDGPADFPDNDLPFDPDNFEWLFVINEHVVPPNLSLANFAGRGAVRLGPLYGNTFTGEFTYVGPSYFSLANTGFIQDRLGIKLNDSWWLMNNSLFVTGGYQYYEDNLEDTLLFTTKNNGYSASVYVYPTAFLNFNAGADIFTTRNDAPSGDPDEVDTSNTTLNGGGSVNFAAFGASNNAYTSVSATLFKDNADSTQDFNDYTTRFGLTSYFDAMPLDTTAVVGFDFGDSPNQDSVYLQGGAGYAFLPNENLYGYTDVIYETGPELFDLTVGAELETEYDISVETEVEYIDSPSTEDLFISAFVTYEF